MGGDEEATPAVIPIAIVAHPARRKLAESLAEQVNAEVILWDDCGLGAGRNHLRAWQWMAEHRDREWGVVLEDDVVPMSGFRTHLSRALEGSPTPVLSLYLGRGRPLAYQQRIAQRIAADVSYLVAPDLLSAQGYAMPVYMFKDAIKFLNLRMARGKMPPDEALSAWCRNRSIKVGFCRQSLVDHLDGPTLVKDHGDGQPRNGRTALVTPDSAGGEDLPEVRRAWIRASFPDWTKGSAEL